MHWNDSRMHRNIWEAFPSSLVVKASGHLGVSIAQSSCPGSAGSGVCCSAGEAWSSSSCTHSLVSGWIYAVKCTEKSVVSSRSAQAITPTLWPCLYLGVQRVLVKTSFCLTAEMINRTVFRQENPIRAQKTTAPGNPSTDETNAVYSAPTRRQPRPTPHRPAFPAPGEP